MSVFVYYNDDYPEGKGFGFEKFDDKEKAQEFIDERMRSNSQNGFPPELVQYRMIEGEEIELPYKAIELNTGDFLASLGF